MRADNEQELSVAAAIQLGTAEAMRLDESVIVYGLGVNDPGRVFGTTAGLIEEFGPTRVFEVPASENALTGIAVGASLGGLRPVVVHHRADFLYLAMDQIVNSAAKWRFMYGGQFSVPIVIRMIVGKGWGQGPTHSQTVHSWLANVPGLKVVTPSDSSEARTLLRKSVEDNNPVLFIEDRAIHSQTSMVGPYKESFQIGQARIAREGQDISIVAGGGLVQEALKASTTLQSYGISSEVVDFRSFLPFDFETIIASAKKTKRVLFLDNAHASASFGESVLGRIRGIMQQDQITFSSLIAWPDHPQPTSEPATKGFYADEGAIISTVASLFGINSTESSSIGDGITTNGRVFMGPF